ncbi:MAG: HTH-type transcriptional regulator CdhR [Pseudomonas citronellolis]|nr:MAG: HTH-type transcriptional regulator CdhR [Pseudomonas citronellolis]
MKTVALVLYEDVLMLDVAGPMEVFSVANRYLPAERHYRLLTLAAGERSVRASSGLALSADALLEDAPAQLDLLLVPGGPGAYNGQHDALSAWLPGAARRAGRYGAICTGAFLLGSAGLLDGYRCTTHWNYLERLAQRFPATRVDPEQVYVVDRNLVTSGGVTAGIDMALAMVAEDHGKAVALEVAKVLLVVMKRQGGQAAYGPLLAAVVRDGSAIARVQGYVVDHIDELFSVNRLAELAAMSPRNFARAFQREAKMTPMEYVQSARIDHARKLLEASELPLKVVACRSGFGSPRHMRGVFSERIGMTPSQYRQQFGCD